MNVLSLTFLKKSIRVLFLVSFVVPAIVGLANAPALAQTSTWSGGAGIWAPCPNNGGNALWDTCNAKPPQYPDGNSNAVIQGGPVTLGPTNGISIVNLTLDAGDSLIITPGYLFINGTSIINQGAISIGDGNGLGIQGPSGNSISLTGGGTITMSTPNTRIAGASGVPTALVNVDNTIQGQGAIGLGEISLVNQKTISANGGTLTIQPNTSGVSNTGLIEAQSGSTLALIGTYTNTGGTIEALDGGTVSLDGGLISGGTLTTTGSGMFTTPPGGDNPMLNGVTNSGLINIPGGASATVQGTITNNGTFQVSGQLFFSGSVTIKGTGTELLQGGTLQLAGGTDSLTNLQLIHGGGTILDLPLTNQGTIEADNTSTRLSLQGSTTTNTATLEASGGGTLDISNNETVNNTGGTIEALTGSTVLLEGTVNGGTLKTSETGVIESENGTLDGTVNVPTNTGRLNVAPAFDLFLQGTVNNTGTITLSGHGCIILNQPTILMGAGKVILGSGNCIFGSGNSLTNESTIEGAGTIGDSNPMPITNDGTIMANKTSPLTIVSNGTGFTNNGKLTVNSGSTLIINSIFGPFNNLVGGTLTGGTYATTGMLEVGSAITTNAASITLTGPSAEILNTPTTNALAGLGANSTTGVLSLQTGQALTTGTSFSNAGKTTVGASSSFTVGGSYTQTAGTTTVDGTLTAPTGLNLQKGTLLGKGTLASAVTSNGTVTVGDATTKAGLLAVTGSYSQQAKGILNLAIGGTAVGSQYSQMAVSNGVSLAGTLTIKRINSFTPTIGEVFTILTGSVVTGTFTTVKGSSINSGEHFEVGYTPTAVTLTVVSGA